MPTPKTLAQYAPEAKVDLGLNLVDNTSDANKPVSLAQAIAIALKADAASPTFTGTVSGITKAMVGLGSVDDTSDAAKPISTAQATALALKAPLASPTFTGTVSGVTKAMVGLGSADNTSDANKPISTAQATVNAAKADLVGGKVPTSQLPSTVIGETFSVASQAAMLALVAQIGDVAIRTDLSNRKYLLLGTSTMLADWSALDASGMPVDSVNGYEGAVVLGKADVGLSNVDNTSDTNKPVSTAQQSALDLKASLASPTFTGTVAGITKGMVGLGNADNTSDASKPVSTAQAAADAAAQAAAIAATIARTADIQAIAKITQAAYDALSPPVATTLYVIVG
jgi:hypothetical protein